MRTATSRTTRSTAATSACASTGGADLLDTAPFSTTAGHVYSLFTVGIHNVLPTNTTPMKLLVCDDSAAPVGHLFACKAVGTQLP